MREVEIAKLVSQLPITSVNHKIFFLLWEFIFPLKQNLLNALGHIYKGKSRAKQTAQSTNFLFLDLHINLLQFMAIECQWKGPLFKTHNSHTPLHSYVSSAANTCFHFLPSSPILSEVIIYYNINLADLGRAENMFPGRRKEWKPQVGRWAKKNVCKVCILHINLLAIGVQNSRSTFTLQALLSAHCKLTSSLTLVHLGLQQW